MSKICNGNKYTTEERPPQSKDITLPDYVKGGLSSPVSLFTSSSVFSCASSEGLVDCTDTYTEYICKVFQLCEFSYDWSGFRDNYSESHMRYTYKVS